MKLSGLIAFTACIFLFSTAMGQTSQSPGSQTPKASHASPAPEASPSSGTGFIRNPFVQQPQASSSAQPPASTGSGPTQQQIATALMEHARQQAILADRGIYARNPGNFCGTIVSYNFSQGNSPHVENVTTCTPSSKVIMRQAQDEHLKLAAPQLLTK